MIFVKNVSVFNGGVEVQEAIAENIALAKSLWNNRSIGRTDVQPFSPDGEFTVSFCFNGVHVTVDDNSNPEGIYVKWSLAMTSDDKSVGP